MCNLTLIHTCIFYYYGNRLLYVFFMYLLSVLNVYPKLFLIVS